MIIKKFQAGTETEAMILAKEELGKDAIVMNIKTIKPKGFYGLFRKPLVEVTAAVDDNVNYNSSLEKPKVQQTPAPIVNPNILVEEQETESAIEKKLNDLQKLLENQLVKNEESKEITEEIVEDKEDTKQALGEKNAACIQLIYNQLVNNEMDEKYAKQIISEIEKGISKEAGVDNVLSSVYQKIILKLGQRKPIELLEKGPKFLFFVGPTGVGKTTTIAKLASDFALKKKTKVGFIASDTYRIAAVEQLKTYANILGIPLQVIYSAEDMDKIKKEFKDMELVFVDTAGRSHQNQKQKEEIARLISSVPEEEREVFLVLSATTKYRDLLKIADCYSEVADYNLIFTKLDETSCIGNIYNLKMYTGAPLSYTTFGQNVPDDIGIIDAQSIAKKLLGGND
ncbi:flagellar biosynthesis protein FlhF [Acetivibrio ethanolgignens]|uniref:Flagellar biosynthesis protein FlhF n=1 Tax=Acetivibrio ethanolgignens TaxID=290052 RepID=A0A0V8QJH1_9FIRM|nr:flagellar biosynthesis protein FlhF [Acetivibrio ethanolgignens]KSV60696.1 flagellar biosynthesis protein FlhF [Acetivibrio ethanolgignens]